MRVILFLLLNISILFGDMLTIYRLYGIDTVQKQMDLDLGDKSYWDKYLSKIDTTFGYIEGYDNLLICDKSKSNLKVYIREAGSKYTLINNYSAFTGRDAGDKVREGDYKTPIGIYNITKKISKLDSFYGPLAFVTSYPNIYDRYQGKEGHGIWIHGVPEDKDRKSYTKGCIAINNSDIKCLDKDIDIDRTLLIISPNKNTKKVTKEQLAIILSQLYRWRYSWIYGDIDGYLDFYSKDFIRADGMKFSRFKKYKTRVFQKPEQKSIVFSDISVIPYPTKEGVFKVSFDESYKSDSLEFDGKKVLIIKILNNRIQIITEK